MSLTIIPVNNQSPGAFDNGRIAERRPVMYVRGGKRVGPLFYWAWAVAEQGGFIAEHPHQGFEIVSYVLAGTVEHRDSLGTWKSLHAGDVQVMQTNSGVEHSERFIDTERTQLFQLWFEPNLRETILLPATYTDYPASLFTAMNAGGNKITHLLGEGAPAPLRTDAHLHDITLRAKGFLKFSKDNYFAVVVAINGDGEIAMGDEKYFLKKGDAAIARMDTGEALKISAGENPFRYAQVVVPATTAYSLYPDF